MWIRNPKLPLNATTALATILTIVVALYAINLLVVGETFTVVPETIIGETNNGTQLSESATIERVPYPPAIIPLSAAVLLLAGLLMRKQLPAWIGLGILLIFSVLFLFGRGGALLPIAGILLILLPLIHFMQKKSFDQLEAP